VARIKGITNDQTSLLTRFIFWFARRQFRQVPEPLRLMAHSRQILFADCGYEFWLQRAHRLDPRLVGLAGLKAGALVGCPW